MACGLAPKYMMRSTKTFPFRRFRNPKPEEKGLKTEISTILMLC
jgi:hypothetical protein